MNRTSGHYPRFLFWMAGAAIALTPIALAPSGFAQQAQANGPANWGQAGPPPDAQNGQPPPPPADAGNGAATDQTQDAAPPPPPPPPPPPANTQGEQTQEGQNGQAPPQSQPGQWGQAGPPPDVQGGNIPPPPQGEQGGRAPYQPNANQQPYQPQEQLLLPKGPVTLSSGTPLQVRISDPLDTRKLQPGDYFRGTVAQSVYLHNMLAIPRGAEVTGRVVDVKKPGELKGSAGFTLQISSLNLGGRSYPLASDTWSMNSPGKGGYTAGNTVGGAALGAIIGAVAGGGPGAAIGAVAGTGVGLGASAATSGPRGVIPPESVLAFHLTQPVTLQPVSYQEAQELVQNSAPPSMQYQRGYAPYPPPPYATYAAPYGYGAPYPYAYRYPYPAYPYAYGYPYPYMRYYRYRRY